MIPTMKSLGIDQLPRDVQVALVQEIWDNIAGDSETVPLSQTQVAELERRLVEDESDPDGGIPWEDVKRKALERLKR